MLPVVPLLSDHSNFKSEAIASKSSKCPPLSIDDRIKDVKVNPLSLTHETTLEKENKKPAFSHRRNASDAMVQKKSLTDAYHPLVTPTRKAQADKIPLNPAAEKPAENQAPIVPLNTANLKREDVKNVELDLILRKPISKSTNLRSNILLRREARRRLAQSGNVLKPLSMEGRLAGKTTFDAVQKRLLDVRELIEKLHKKNHWASALKSNIDVLIGDARCPLDSPKNFAQRLDQFIAAYDSSVTLEDAQIKNKKLRKFLILIIGGGDKKQADGVVNYLRKAQAEALLKAAWLERIDGKVENPPSNDLSALPPLNADERIEDDPIMSDKLLSRMALLDRSFLDPSEIPNYFKLALQSKLPEAFQKGGFSLGEALALRDLPQVKRNLDTIQDIESFLLYPFRARIKEAYEYLVLQAKAQAAYGYSDLQDLQAKAQEAGGHLDLQDLQAKCRGKISPQTMKFLNFLRALYLLDDKSLASWQEQDSEFNPRERLPLSRFVDLLKGGCESRVADLSLLAFILTGNEKKDVNVAAEHLKALAISLEKYSQKNLTSIVGQGAEIHEHSYFKRIAPVTIARTLFGIQEMTHEKDLGKYRADLDKPGKGSLIPNTITVNRKEIPTKGYEGSSRKIQESFYRSLLTALEEGGFKINEVEGEVKRLVEKFAASTPFLLDHLEFISTSWKQLGRQAIDRKYSDLGFSQKKLAIRDNKETNVAYTVFDKDTVICSQIIKSTIFPGDWNNGEWFAVHENQPLGEVTFEWVGMLHKEMDPKTGQMVLTHQKSGFLRMTDWQIYPIATKEQRIEIFNALKMPEAAKKLQSSGSGLLPNLSSRRIIPKAESMRSYKNEAVEGSVQSRRSKLARKINHWRKASVRA